MVVIEEESVLQIRRHGKNWITYVTIELIAVRNASSLTVAGVLFCNMLWHGGDTNPDDVGNITHLGMINNSLRMYCLLPLST